MPLRTVGEDNMAFHSDDSTLIDSHPTLEPGSSSIPPNNYLWTSPAGQALPGWHHQLILHLLSLDQSWTCKPQFEFSTIKLWLRDLFPAYAVDESLIRAVAVQYLELDEGLKAAYRGMAPLLESRPKQGQNTDAFTEQDIGPDIESDRKSKGLIDPALFDRSSTKAAAIRQTHAHNNATTRFKAPEADFHVESLIRNQVGKVTDSFTERIIITRDSDNESTSAHDQDITNTPHYAKPGALNLRAHAAMLPSTPPGRTTITVSPLTPEANRVISNPSKTYAMLPEQPSPTPKTNIQSVKSGKQPSADDELVINEENARMYAPLYLKALVDLGYEQGWPKTRNVSEERYETNEPTKVSVTDSSVPVKPQPLSSIPKSNSNKTNLPKPDPTKYEQTSRNHWKIPHSEADKFVAYFDVAVDPIPDRIEGYFWYCEKCYAPKQDKDVAGVPSDSNAPEADPDNITYPCKRRRVVKKVTGGHTKGKFSGKRSIEKHMHDVHKISWKCNVLPEPERGAGTSLLPLQSEVHAAAEVQGFQAGQDTCQSFWSTSPQPPAADLSDEENGADVAPDSVRRKLFVEELAERASKLKQGTGKQAPCNPRQAEGHAWRQILDEKVGLAQIKETCIFDKDEEVANPKAYNDLSPASSAYKMFHQHAEEETGSEEVEIEIQQVAVGREGIEEQD